MKRLSILANFNQVTVVNDDGTTDVGHTDLSPLLPRWVHAIHFDPAANSYEVEFIKPPNATFTLAELGTRFPGIANMIAAGRQAAADARTAAAAKQAAYDAAVAQAAQAEAERIASLQAEAAAASSAATENL